MTEGWTKGVVFQERPKLKKLRVDMLRLRKKVGEEENKDEECGKSY